MCLLEGRREVKEHWPPQDGRVRLGYFFAPGTKGQTVDMMVPTLGLSPPAAYVWCHVNSSGQPLGFSIGYPAEKTLIY